MTPKKENYLAKVRVWKILRFMYTQRIRGFSIQEAPHFDSEESTGYFLEKLKDCRSYLEFGSGGSTCLAAKLGKPFTAVDSDPIFLKAVRNKIIKEGLFDECNQKFIYADIGLTEKWGKPVTLLTPSVKRLDAFRKYSDFPLSAWDSESLPDLILVDGRFRVACALKAFRVLRNQKNWILIVDDYAKRPSYHVLEKFAKLERRVGRMAVFADVILAQEDELAAAIERYVHDSR